MRRAQDPIRLSLTDDHNEAEQAPPHNGNAQSKIPSDLTCVEGGENVMDMDVTQNIKLLRLSSTSFRKPTMSLATAERQGY